MFFVFCFFQSYGNNSSAQEHGSVARSAFVVVQQVQLHGKVQQRSVKAGGRKVIVFDFFNSGNFYLKIVHNKLFNLMAKSG
jgi:hypothetical protein